MPLHHKTTILLLLTLLFTTPTHAATPPNLTGTWLLQSAPFDHESHIESGWNSLLTITPDNSFTLTNFMGTTQTFKAAFTLNPNNDPTAVDLQTQPVDISERWAGEKYKAASILARYALADGTLSLSYNFVDNHRPANLTTIDRKTVNLSFRRAAPNFKSLPDKITVTVLDPAGKPDPHATLFHIMYIPMKATFFQHPTDPPLNWAYSAPLPARPDGTLEIPTDKLKYNPIGVRDPDRHLIGFAASSPAELQSGKLTVTLQPEASIHGTMSSEEFTQLHKKIEWTNVYLLFHGQRIASDYRTPGQFQFPVPPGNYTLEAYGTDLHSNFIDITVPPNTPDLQIPNIPLTASKLALLQNHPVPEFENVLAWKNGPVKFADLKGKIILIDFWGYWCGPCVYSMPALLDLHEKIKDKDFVILTVHVDNEGEVDTVAKLDEKIADTKKELWKNRDLPFPTALTSGKPLDTPDGVWQRGGIANQFGILSYPTTLLVNREGILVGQFYVDDDPAIAASQIQHLLHPDTPAKP